MPDDAWWTGSPEAGAQRSVEMGLPLPPGAAMEGWGREARNASVMSGGEISTVDALMAMTEAEALRREEDEKARREAEKLVAAQARGEVPVGNPNAAAAYQPYRPTAQTQDSWETWSPIMAAEAMRRRATGTLG